MAQSAHTVAAGGLAGTPVKGVTTMAAAVPAPAAAPLGREQVRPTVAQAQRPPGLRLLMHLLLLCGALVNIFPFYWMVVTSFKSNAEAMASPPTFVPAIWHPENYPLALSQAPFGRYFFNTAFIAFWTVVGVLVVSALAAYAFARMEFFGKKVLFGAFLATLMIPGEVTLIPNFVMVTKWLGWYDTYQAQIVPSVGSVIAIFLLRQFFMSIPKDLEDAAKIDGCSTLRFLWAILLPLSTPALITVALLNFLATWNAFLWPLLVTRSPQMRPIQLGLQVFSSEFGSRYAELMAASTLVILPTVVVYLVAQRYFVEGIARTGLRG
ncbi:MAG TPA: carbohydrate ABC transporter permease [Chloroflexota bacterium]|nr:carbohydrate ABC transporter permease [Chloroflexota bacterium]